MQNASVCAVWNWCGENAKDKTKSKPGAKQKTSDLLSDIQPWRHSGIYALSLILIISASTRDCVLGIVIMQSTTKHHVNGAQR
jgi:hypothetical protein